VGCANPVLMQRGCIREAARRVDLRFGFHSTVQSTPTIPVRHQKGPGSSPSPDVSRPADKHDISAVADLIAVSIASALTSGDSYTYEDVRRANLEQGWTYELRRGQGRAVERIESIHLSEEQLSLAWLTANRRVDNEAGLYWPS
jgi:hypothetical protein